MPRHVLASRLLFACLALFGSACGSRTSLETPQLSPCDSEGATRACADGCGAGAQTCTDGTWTPCVVPTATRPCNDGCADGEEQCTQGAWQSCVAPQVTRPCESVCGAGKESCRAGAWGVCDAPQPKPPKLKATVRDFSPKTHPDFEASYKSGLDLGIVEPTLGVDDKPVYAGFPRTPSTTNKEAFDSWFRDDARVNQTAPVDLQLTASKEDKLVFVYESSAFFPIDGELLDNEGNFHNFHFTLEASTIFKYVGGEVFSFSGDDDMWVFVNRQLVIDLGGLHPRLSGAVSLDEVAGPLGLQKGQVYPLHFFFAERHTDASTFTIRTSIAEPGSCE